MIYHGYLRLQRAKRRMDFNEVLMRAVLLLREQPEVRLCWQRRYQHVLVDEYQDIEPTQELLVRLVAAPHDELFCVGDEDQTIYAWRRASVQRMICLDELYPGLRRIQLDVNFRCPPEVVAASERLIAVNRMRFPKRIEPDPDHPPGRIEPHPVHSQLSAAAATAELLSERRRGEIAVLGRTTNSLRPIALECAKRGVKIDAPAKLFTPMGARHALRCHLQLALHPDEASADLVRAVCGSPGRGLKPGREQAVADACRGDVRGGVRRTETAPGR
jgi:DNA helicase-2/ATP-dependent DNA helicase PcrA